MRHPREIIGCAVCTAHLRWPLCPYCRRRPPAPMRLVRILIAEMRRCFEKDELLRAAGRPTLGVPLLGEGRLQRHEECHRLHWLVLNYFRETVNGAPYYETGTIAQRDWIEGYVRRGYRLRPTLRRLVRYADRKWLGNPYDLYKPVSAAASFRDPWWSAPIADRLHRDGFRIHERGYVCRLRPDGCGSEEDDL